MSEQPTNLDRRDAMKVILGGLTAVPLMNLVGIASAQSQAKDAQVITIHIGGAGCRLGAMYWELLSAQHGIDLNGQRIDASSGDAIYSCFSRMASGKHYPRAVFVDTTPEAIDEVRAGHLQHTFQPEQLINFKEGAAGIFGRGRNTIGLEVIDQIMDRIHKQADACSNLQGFILVMGVDGGTGSGLGQRILEKISADFSGIPKLAFAVYADGEVRNTVPVPGPYNAIFATAGFIDYADACVVLNNQWAYDLLRRHADLERPELTDLNRVLVQVIAEVTNPLCTGNGAQMADVLGGLAVSGKVKFITHDPGVDTVPDSTWHLRLLPGKVMANAQDSMSMVGRHFSSSLNDFNKLYRRKSYVHWYTQAGMGESDFTMARDKVLELGKHYPIKVADQV